ncbi:MAG: hypothetical protein BroJett040_23030 [Oligoflexia bacterium]|nr:MAG: hypothetical protein BroJett040_23030 [Oligoflexia bacterium]
MKQFLTLLKYELLNVLRGRWLFFYTLLFSGVSYAIAKLGGDSMKAALSLLNMVLLVTPIVSILYSAIYWYNSDGFTTLLLTQPLRRWGIFASRWIAISLTLSLCFVVGTALPFVIDKTLTGAIINLLLMGTGLTFAFTSIGLLVSVIFNDRMKGIGAAFLLWFYFSIVHDGLVFLTMVIFREYPLEKPSMALVASNPIDLTRIMLLMKFDVAALMGYTGRVLQRFFSNNWGYWATLLVLLLWIIIPLAASIRRFNKKDF